MSLGEVSGLHHPRRDVLGYPLKLEMALMVGQRSILAPDLNQGAIDRFPGNAVNHRPADGVWSRGGLGLEKVMLGEGRTGRNEIGALAKSLRAASQHRKQGPDRPPNSQSSGHQEDILEGWAYGKLPDEVRVAFFPSFDD